MVKRIFLFLFVCSGIAAYVLIKPIYSPQSFEKEEIFLVKKGHSVYEIADDLVQQNLMPNRLTFFTAGLISASLPRLKPGEYAIPPHSTPIEIVKIIASGKRLIRKLTIPEGLTVAAIVKKIQEAPAMEGTIDLIPAEGTLLPETYTYEYGQDRQKMLNHLKKSMEKCLEKALKNKPNDSILKTPQQVLVMASIVEKETGVASERARVAAVFLNRLRLGMRLQSDPTVIYGITLGQYKLDRPITKADLKNETPYNTYTIDGMPPTPIACPGRQAIEAVLNPSSNDDVYFVADGTGGHAFARTLDAHNENVRAWRKIENSR